MLWANYPNFTEAEFRCRHCGQQQMQPEFMEKLQALRHQYGRPLRVTSGYRCPDHPIEKAKAHPGMHATGLAADGKAWPRAVRRDRSSASVGITEHPR